METLVPLILNALTLISILMLVGLGLAIIFGLMNVINLAHGEFVTIGAYTLALVTDVEKVIPALSQVEFDAPQGHVNFSAENNHMLANSILAKAKADGSWELIENFGQVKPVIPGCKLG